MRPSTLEKSSPKNNIYKSNKYRLPLGATTTSIQPTSDYIQNIRQSETFICDEEISHKKSKFSIKSPDGKKKLDIRKGSELWGGTSPEWIVEPSHEGRFQGKKKINELTSKYDVNREKSKVKTLIRPTKNHFSNSHLVRMASKNTIRDCKIKEKDIEKLSKEVNRLSKGCINQFSSTNNKSPFQTKNSKFIGGKKTNVRHESVYNNVDIKKNSNLVSYNEALTAQKRELDATRRLMIYTSAYNHEYWTKDPPAMQSIVVSKDYARSALRDSEGIVSPREIKPEDFFTTPRVKINETAGSMDIRRPLYRNSPLLVSEKDFFLWLERDILIDGTPYSIDELREIISTVEPVETYEDSYIPEHLSDNLRDRLLKKGVSLQSEIIIGVQRARLRQIYQNQQVHSVKVILDSLDVSQDRDGYSVDDIIYFILRSNLNSSGDTLLHMAAQEGSLDFVQYFSTKCNSLTTLNWYGWSALTFAVYHANLDVTLWLLENSPHLVKIKTANGSSILHVFAESKSYSHDKEDEIIAFTASTIVPKAFSIIKSVPGKHMKSYQGLPGTMSRALVKSLGPGCLNERDQYGRNPLQCAVFRGCFSTCSSLLACGANPNCRDLRGDQPLHIAARLGYVSICALLIAHGAKVNELDTENLEAKAVAFKFIKFNTFEWLLSREAK